MTDYGDSTMEATNIVAELLGFAELVEMITPPQNIVILTGDLHREAAYEILQLRARVAELEHKR